MPIQRHNVIIPTEDGGVEVYPLKEWLRQHPEQTPPGLDPTSSTSHQLRNGLRRLGWTTQETPTEVRLIKRGSDSDSEIADKILGNDGLQGNEAEEPSFTLEYQLRDFLASNLSTIKIVERRLRLFVDPTGCDGIEFPTAVGPIDILAVDEEGSFFVFELKRANSADRAIGQLARYMGWVQHTIGRGRNVSGVIVARSISENLRYAASVVPNVHLLEYEIEFHLHSAHDMK
jgi:RecB family endonuclease NucS